MTARLVVTAPPIDPNAKTLGWGVIDWIEANCVQPDGPNAGQSFRLTDGQARFLLRWYEVKDDGSFRWRYGVYRRSKGFGKSPFGGAVALAEQNGPVRFSHWGADGQPVGRPVGRASVDIAGTSHAQTANTFDAIRGLVGNPEESVMVADYGVDPGATRILAADGGRITPVTTASRTLEGRRTTFALSDEAHHHLESNGGWAMNAVLGRNAAKMDGRVLVTTNAWEPGEDSVAELDHKAWSAELGKVARGEVAEGSILYDSVEAHDVDLADPEDIMAGLRMAYAEAPWVNLERLREEIMSPRAVPSEVRRFYFNVPAAHESAWITSDEFMALADPNVPPLREGEEIVLGFDGSVSDDSTVLVGVRVSDEAPFTLGLWERPRGAHEWEVDRDSVRDRVDHVLVTYKVVAWAADVAWWESDTAMWELEYGPKLAARMSTTRAIGFDMRGNRAEVTHASEALRNAVMVGAFKHDGQPDLARHMSNTRSVANRHGVTFAKKSRMSDDKVDLVAGLLLARIALSRYRQLTRRGRKSGKSFGF